MPGYDINDLYTGKPVDREPILWSDVRKRYNFPPEAQPSICVPVFTIDFIMNYDIDDCGGKEKADEIVQIVRAWKQVHPVIQV